MTTLVERVLCGKDGGRNGEEQGEINENGSKTGPGW